MTLPSKAPAHPPRQLKPIFPNLSAVLEAAIFYAPKELKVDDVGFPSNNGLLKTLKKNRYIAWSLLRQFIS